MSLKTEAYIVPDKGAKLELLEIELPPLLDTEVECDIIMCGLCHTDIHMRDNDWGISDFPMCLGHEGVGVVRAKGPKVEGLQIGDRIAVTWMRNSCGSCGPCEEGRENICREGYQGTYLGKSAGCWGTSPLKYNEHGGAFAKVQRIEEKYAVKIPDEVPSEIACPLLCGGGTVFEPIKDYVTRPGMRVGILGIGGLGTAAIKLCKLLDPKGTAIALSGTASKREGILAAGADEFLDMKNPEEVAKAAGSLDFILDTTPVNGDVASSMALLVFNGVYCRVGIPSATDMTFKYDYIPLIFTQKKIVGSIITGNKRMAEMLELVSKNLDFMKAGTDTWDTTTMPMSEVNDAMEQLQNRTNKGYRIILKW